MHHRQSYIKNILKKYSCKGYFIDLRYSDVRYNKIAFTGNSLRDVGIVDESGYLLRVIHDRYYISIKFEDIAQLDDCIQNSIDILGDNLTYPWAEFYSGNPVTNEIKYNSSIFEAGNEYKVNILNGYINLVKNFSSKVKCAVQYNDCTGSKEYFNTLGSYIFQELSFYTCVFTLTYNDKNFRNQSILLFGEGNGNFHKFSLQENIIIEKLKYLIVSNGLRKVDEGNYDIIMSPEIAALFIHETIGHMLEADNICKDESLRNSLKIGTCVGPEFLNVIDDPTIPGLNGSFDYDDEGVKSKKKYLIKNGLIDSYLGNIMLSNEMKLKIEGNARAININHSPIVRMSNTYIESNSSEGKDFFKDVKNGLYVKGLLGGNTNRKTFYFNCGECYLVKDGKTAGPLSGVTISGDILEALKKIKRIYGDFEWTSGGGCGKLNQNPLPVSMGSPHILLENIHVRG